jgi:hypothetical protein
MLFFQVHHADVRICAENLSIDLEELARSAQPPPASLNEDTVQLFAAQALEVEIVSAIRRWSVRTEPQRVHQGQASAQRQRQPVCLPSPPSSGPEDGYDARQEDSMDSDYGKAPNSPAAFAQVHIVSPVPHGRG